MEFTQKCLKRKGVGIMNKDCKNISLWKMVRTILPQTFFVSPGLFILTYVLFALNGVLFAAFTICLQILFDKITNFTLHKCSLKTVILALFLLFSVKIFEELASAFANFIAESYDSRSFGKLSRIVNLKIADRKSVV